MKTSTASERVFVDTWGWLVLANQKDPNYLQVLDLRRRHDALKHRWTTTDYVLDETITRLFAATAHSQARKFMDGVLEAASSGRLDLEFIGLERFQAAWKLRMKYNDKPRISFTDLTSFVVMREVRIARVLTGDAHFSQIGLGFETIP